MYFRLYHQIYASGFYKSWLHIRHLPTRALTNHCKFTSFPDLLISEMLRHLQFETRSAEEWNRFRWLDICKRRTKSEAKTCEITQERETPPLKPPRATKAKIVKFPFFSIVSPISCVFSQLFSPEWQQMATLALPCPARSPGRWRPP